MPKRKPPRALDPARIARKQARGQVGHPPAERVIPDKRKKPPKHKKKWIDEA